jgi:hypothetical protein
MLAFRAFTFERDDRGSIAKEAPQGTRIGLRDLGGRLDPTRANDGRQDCVLYKLYSVSLSSVNRAGGTAL